MFRRGLIISLMLGAMPVMAAAWVWSPALLELVTEAARPGGGSKEAAAQLSGLDALKQRDGSAKGAGFDVARIDRDGWSVFAGTAPAHSSVTVTADGVPIGTAKADERGEWSLLSDHRFQRNDPVLDLSTQFDRPEQTPVASQPAAEPRSAGDADPSRRMMKNFEDLVAAARNPQPPDGSPSAVRAPVPIPIKFAFRRAVLTEEGQNAAMLLLEYLKLKKPESIVLTGHADERGSEAFNVILSRRRLDTVADFLKQNGYAGRLVLIPKGSSEPYDGVDRSSFDQHALWQLDRRVEFDLQAATQPTHRLGQRASE
jgi:outer membrane protein OmpA-like peptidoglycan-associated protein